MSYEDKSNGFELHSNDSSLSKDLQLDNSPETSSTVLNTGGISYTSVADQASSPTLSLQKDTSDTANLQRMMDAEGNDEHYFSEDDVTSGSSEAGSHSPHADARSQESSVMFHLYVHKVASKVTLQFETEQTGDNAEKCTEYTLQCMRTKSFGKYWRVSVPFHENLKEVRYKYKVSYHQAQVRKEKMEHSYRSGMCGRRNHYDVFKETKTPSKPNRTFKGKLFYIKRLYNQCKDCANLHDLHDIWEDIECVNLGEISDESAQSFLDWVNKEGTNELTPYTSAVLCSLLGQVPRKSVSSKINKEVADKLLHLLCQCTQSRFPEKAIESIQKIHLEIIGKSTWQLAVLEYVDLFKNVFPAEVVINCADTFKALQADKFDDTIEAFIKSLMSLQDIRQKEMLVKFVISKAPSVSSMFKLSRQLDMIESYSRAITNRLPKLFQKEQIINLALWKKIPDGLKPDVTTIFFAELTKRIERIEHDDMFEIILDKDVQRFASDKLVTYLLTLSQSKSQNLDLVCSLMKDKRFLSFWDKNITQKADSRKIVENLAKSTMETVISKTSEVPKEKVAVAMLLNLDKLCQITALKGFEKTLRDVVVECVSRYDLQTIVNAYIESREETTGEDVDKLFTTVVKERLKTNDDPQTDVKSQLLDCILALSSKCEEMNREKGDILILLLEKSMVPSVNSRSATQPNELRSVVDAVLSEKKMWTVIFKESENGGRLSNHEMYLDVKSVMDELNSSFIDGHISLNCIINEDDQNKLADFLALGGCSPRGIDVSVVPNLRYKWLEILSKLLAEKSKIERDFDLLDRLLFLLKEITARETLVKLEDMKILLEEYDNRKRNWEETEFADIRHDNYWGHLKSLLNSGEDIYPFCSLILFKNFAINQLDERIQTIQTRNTVGQGQLSNADFTSIKLDTVDGIIKFLNDGVKSFKEIFRCICEHNSTVASKELDKILADDIKLHSIEEEFRSVCDILNLPHLSQNASKMLNDYLRFDSVKTKIQTAMDCWDAVGYVLRPVAEQGPFLQTLLSFLNCKESGTLNSVSSYMNDRIIVNVNLQLSQDLVDTLFELSRAKELIEFITKTAQDNMVVLVDAVEEYSDHSSIQASTVSYLIDVHRFFSELLSDKPREPEMFLSKVFQAHATLTGGIPFMREVKMAAKIKDVSCHVHSLRGLHMTLSNREEVTKEVIQHAVNNGSYKVWIDVDGSVGVQLTYGREDQKEAKYNIDDLNDLRSRALLLVNTEKMQKSAVDGEKSNLEYQNDLRLFIDQVDLLKEIVREYKVLKMSGIPKYEKYFWMCLRNIDEIRQEEARVNSEAKEWDKMIQSIREQYFFLNYFHTNQLWILISFFNNHISSAKEVPDEVLALFQYIDGEVNCDFVFNSHSKYVKSKADTQNELCEIGKTLKEIFGSSHEKFSHPTKKKSAVVEPSKLYVGVLEANSVQTVHVIMSLFENTCGYLPKPSQLLICSPHTTWDEIELLLLRTFGAHRHGFSSKLHCIANVEYLPNDIQFELADKLEALVRDTDAPYLLAIVCRGEHQYIADHFADCAHTHGGMPDADIREAFKVLFPDTFLVTGDLSGLGKSEEIYAHAGEKGRVVLTFPVSGPFVRTNLVKRLSELKLNNFQSIHFDIGEVDDPIGLDTFLFELIVTKMVSSGALIFSLANHHVYIEIANTLNQEMRNSLPVCTFFRRLQVEWKDYSNLLASKELTSSIQVVCQYLNAYFNNDLQDTEVVLKGPKRLKPLSSEKCQELLKRSFCPDDLNFNIVHIFLSVLANQLLKFSRNPYLKPDHLKSMPFQKHQKIRNDVFKAILDASAGFAVRSVRTCKMETGGGTTAEQMVDRVTGMTQWADIQHLVIMLSPSGSITPLYRNLKEVPQNVKELFSSQNAKWEGLKDYTSMSQCDLQEILETFSAAPLNVDRAKLASLNYVLTPDNLLKMALIIQRMQAITPVVIMGETGCGKTSLVRYLAQTCNIPFDVFNFHAGITEQQIIDFINSKDKEAKNLQKNGKSIWVFLDEINTSDHLGTINEIVCHRSIHGKPLASNLMFVAACNPYILRPQECIVTAGLTGKATFDEFSKLVYRVHPLPETMIDYVWDYGSLSGEDEKAYIGRMVEKVFDGPDPEPERDMFVDLLATSQEFIRDKDMSIFCVSLRDVRRATILMVWFRKVLSSRKQTITSESPTNLQTMTISDKVKAIVLSLAHCYLSRLPTQLLRNMYCSKMTEVLIKHGQDEFDLKANAFKYIIRAEQEDYLSRMELPEGTAKNAALRENVFVILVCILNRIPVFLVGKPGCSKSFSMQIIRSNLRGRDSKDQFLKTLPKLMVVSFQGSESSTSEGIEKVFKKARQFKNEAENILPVVLLDEIGLAEISKCNPLKVLHNLLETEEGEFPDVAVVGISNWALDAAKMNRAIHLSRPEPDEKDLYETGLSIRAVKKVNEKSIAPYIKCLAEAYSDYQVNQKHDNFHGLRDYYSMVKCVDISDRLSDANSQKIQRAMQRNFGGTDVGKGELQSAFLRKLGLTLTIWDKVDFHVTELIRDNLNDKLARHLMLITSGNSAIEILNKMFQDLKKDKIAIFGSSFKEDLSPDYSHRVLSRIILCMERNCILILHDLERIYGSLYDMLNQNYMVVGGKKNCRVALGAFSNPMCQVNDGFRCIVLVDEDKVDYSDPPFLNRFEKQLLRFSDILDDRQRTLIKELDEWAESISSLHGHETQFDKFDMFAGFHEDTLPSVVLLHSKQVERSDKEVLERCKDDLMTIAMPDAVIRSRNSKLNQMNDEEVNKLYHNYFEKPIHDGLKTFLEHTFENHQKGDHGSAALKLLIMTHSSIHNDVSKSIEDLFEVQIEKLSFFKSEKELSKRIKYFWLESKSNLLVVQCRPETDAPHMLLVKTIIEEQRTAFINSPQGLSEKHVCIVVHLRRSVKDECDYRWQFNFLSGWSQVMIECLEKPVVLIREMLEYSVIDVLLKSETVPFNKAATDQVLWCFTQIRFPTTKPCNLDLIPVLISAMTSCPDIMNCFMELCCGLIGNQLEGSETTWQIDVACDRQALINSSTLVKAMEYFIIHTVRLPLARIIYFLQKHSAFQALTSNDVATRQECLKLISNESVFQINKIPPPQGAESLVVEATYAGLRFPFSTFFCDRVDTLLDFFTDEHRNHCLEQDNVDENGDLTSNATKVLVRKMAMKVEQVINEITDSPVLTEQLNEYIEDFFDIKTDDASDFLSRHQRIAIMKAHYGEKMPDFTNPNPVDVSSVIAQLHCNFWIEDNAVPNVLYFIRECIDINIPGFNVEDLISRYHGQEKRNMMADDGEASERNDENLEDNGLSQTDMEPAEGKDLWKLPEEHSENEDIFTCPVQESHQCLNDDQSSGIQNEQAKDKNQETVLGDFEDEPLQQPQSQNSSDIESSCVPQKQYQQKDKEMLVEDHKDEAFQQTHWQNRSDIESSGLPQETSKEKNEEISAQNLEDETLKQTHSHENVDDAANTNSEQSTVDNAGDAESTFSPESVFEYFVVEDVCLSLIPTDNVIQLFGGIAKWKSAVSLVLSSVSKYRIPIEVSYFLKVCNDFANLIPLEIEPYSLFEIGKRGEQVDNQNYLDSEEIFQSVCDSVQVLRDKGHDEAKLNEFLFQFYERCIESNPDSPMMGEILSKVSLSEDENMLHLASSILHQILLSENDAFAPQHLEKLITSTELDEFPNLSKINVALSILHENEKELDCHVNVICCDLINKLYFKDLDIQDVTSSNDALVRYFHQAVSILSETDENLKTTMFRFICAVAYLRAYMSELARLLSGETKTLDLVLSDICVHLQDDQELQKRKSVVWTFLVKELCQVMCLYDVKKLIQRNEKAHPLMSLEWKKEDACKLEYNPFKLQTAKSTIANALVTYVESKDSKPFTDALDSIITSCEKRQELAAIAIEMFYIVRSLRKLKDTENSVAEFVANSLNKCTLPYKNFISRISSRQSFQCKELEISSQTTTIDFQVASVIQHLWAILTSRFVGKSTNPIMCCLVDPKSLKTSCMVALPDDNSGYPPYKHFKSNTACEVHLFSCKCGIRYVSRESADANCPCCDSHNKEVVKCTGQKITATKGYVSVSPEDLKCDLLHVRNLDPAEFRILHLIVHAALLGGYSLELSTGVLSDVMGDENPSDTCYNIVQIDLEALSSLFCCKKEKIVTLLHHVIESVSQILTDNSGLPIPLDEKGRSSWEGYFSKKVKPVLEKFHCGGFIEKDNQQSYTAVIEERQLPQFADITSRNASIPRLFRVTQPNTFNKLREVYLNSPTELKEKHQLLGLFLDHHDTLHLIGNLVSLLSWSRRVESLLSRAITRKDAKEKKIYDVVLSKESQTPNETKLSKAFEEFKKAWRKVVPLVNESIQDGDKMPYISEITPVGYCLLGKQDLGRYLFKSFYILAKMQNTFLDNCLAIASTGKCPALHFLSKEGSYHLPIIHVQDAKKREIINYEWTDDFLAHSHCSTEYGQGKTITYDMTKMEKELAGCFLFGKAYLDTTSGIREFVFSEQLFHDCANILNELCESIPQDKLPSSVEAELNSSARKSMDRIQTLLGHMELVLWYLKRMEVKPDRSLVEFSDTCIPPSRVFPKDLLPSTLNTIQIRHVCALYEFVEDHLAASSVDSRFEEKYLKNMLDETKKKLEEDSGTFEKVKLEAAITAIKRFVFRYLNMKPHPDESLVKFMRDPSLWPMALRARSDDSTFEVPKEALKFFPKELTIGEIYEIHAFYENLLKKLNAKSAHPRPTTLPTARAPRTSRRPGKKRVMKSGGFS